MSVLCSVSLGSSAVMRFTMRCCAFVRALEFGATRSLLTSTPRYAVTAEHRFSCCTPMPSRSRSKKKPIVDLGAAQSR